MKKEILLFMVLMLLLTACGAGDAAPTPIPINTAIPQVEVDENEAGKSVDEDTEAGTERVTPADGMVQVFVPTGKFQMGGIDPTKSSPNELPDRTVTISSFWLDKLEVTNGMYLLCVDAGACEMPTLFKSETNDKYFRTEEFADYPVIYVTWGNANDYCSWAGKRLPTEAEWERAARGDDFRTFPWGDERPDETRANFNNVLRDVTRVGSYPAGASPFGALDMAGNVWEWVSDFYDEKYYASPNVTSTDPMGPSAAVGKGERHSIRGGSYIEVEKDIRVSKRGYASGPNPDASDMLSVEYIGESSARIGIRCASDN